MAFCSLRRLRKTSRDYLPVRVGGWRGKQESVIHFLLFLYSGIFPDAYELFFCVPLHGCVNLNCLDMEAVENTIIQERGQPGNEAL